MVKNNSPLMGLTIHYTLSVKKGTRVRFLLNVLRRMARRARKIGCSHVGKVIHSSESDPDAPPFFDCVPGRERRSHGGMGTRGWLLEVWPGEGCETAVFGVMQERKELARGKGNRRGWPPSYRTRWKLDGFCKTNYAAEHGLEHFVQCHERVVQLLDVWRQAGFKLQVRDEGGFWEKRSREALAAQIGDHKLFLKMAQSRYWG